MSGRSTGLAARLMAAQVVVIGVGAITLLVSAVIVAPFLFSEHLARTGVHEQSAVDHAEEAFNSAFLISMAVGTAASLVTASVMSWVLVRRVVPPLERLAEATESVADGNYDVEIPAGGMSSELETLSDSFARMAERLQAVDASRTQMLNDLAHEIRTPLATLEVFVEGMEDDVVPVDDQAFEVLHSQIARLQRLAGDVRDAATAGEHALSVELEPLDLAREVELAIEYARPQFQAKGVLLDADLAPALGRVNGDRLRLQQVLTILLSNALRHTPPGGCVQVVARNDGSWVQVRVIDDGEGIRPDQLDRIFERFYRSDSSRTGDGGVTGSGLGLTIARAITIEHGGTISAASGGAGSGATFTIRLPRLRS